MPVDEFLETVIEKQMLIIKPHRWGNHRLVNACYLEIYLICYMSNMLLKIFKILWKAKPLFRKLCTF